jgi:hypothetical protein
MKIRWWPHTTDPRVASYRLRCLRVTQQLRRDGVDAGFLRAGEIPKVLVLSKRYDTRSLDLAVQMRRSANTRLVLDLCDNHFYAESTSPVWKDRARLLKQAVNTVDLVVASTEELAEVVRREADNEIRAVVVGDAVEPPIYSSLANRLVHPVALWSLEVLRRELQRSCAPLGRRLVWFGHQGSGNAESGMSALASIRNLLEAEARAAPLALTVISNNRLRFQQEVAPWQLATQYLPWNAANFSQALQLHQIAVLPIRRNPFTICKSNNRVATAFVHGLAVGADGIPSYAPFADCAVLDDWDRGFKSLMESATLRHARVEVGRKVVAEDWTLPRIATLWREALASA